MELLLKTTDPNQIIDLIQGILEEEFLSLTGMYECNVPEMDYWIKSKIIDRLSDSSVSFNPDRFSQSGGNIINDYVRVFIKEINVDEYEYLVVEDEQYVDQHPDIRSNNYKEAWINYDEAFKNFKKWAYEYINKGQSGS